VQPTHKVRPITTQDVHRRVTSPADPSRAAALKSYLLYRPCAARAPFSLPPYTSAGRPIIAASYYVGSFSARRPGKVALMPDKGHPRCRTYRRAAAKRDTAAIFQITRRTPRMHRSRDRARALGRNTPLAMCSHGPDTA